MSNHIVSRFIAAFGPPKGADVTAVAGEYVRVCKGVPDDVLDAAASNLIASQHYRSWPTVADVAAAIRQATSNPHRNRVFPVELENFEAWWRDKLDRARLSRSDDQLRSIFAEVEPYAASDMINRWRWDELLNVAKHTLQTAERIGIVTPHNVRYGIHFGRPAYLDDGKREPKTPDSIERVRQIHEDYAANRPTIKTMQKPDPQDYHEPNRWAGEIPYRPLFEGMQDTSRNAYLHTRPMTEDERKRYRLSEMSRRMTGEKQEGE